MCRIASYIGPAIPLENIIVRPKHSLLAQSQNAAEGKITVHGDGVGVAWYDPEIAAPGLFLEADPAWGSENLAHLCRMVRSPLFLSHVRAATTGGVNRENCHPFVHGSWSFCHNGQIPGFAAMRRRLGATLPDEFYNLRRGNTDSEMIFLMLLANGLDDDPNKAMRRTLEQLTSTDIAHPIKLTCVLSNGQSLFGFRYSSKGTPPSLYVSGVLDNGGRAITSEPLTGVAEGWTSIPLNAVFRLNRDGTETTALAA